MTHIQTDIACRVTICLQVHIKSIIKNKALKYNHIENPLYMLHKLEKPVY